MSKLIDLRSDTVTKPTPAMRQAMAAAPVGDDVYGEDPTVNALEQRAAQLLGKESALFVASGTMGNLLAILSHCASRGSSVICGDESHIFNYEQGGAAAVGGLVYHTIRTQPTGELPLDDLRAAATRDPANAHYAAPGVICLENTHNRCGGAVLDSSYVQKVRTLATEAKLPLHLDGARLANAAVASSTTIANLAAPFDSVQFDLSKGLVAPVGGIVAGTREFITRARRGRKMLGGGMRQAGVIAAAGIYAIDHNIDRLADDHALARRLAHGLSDCPHLHLDPENVVTNIIIATVASPWTGPTASAALREAGVLAGSPRHDRLRFVTHYDVAREDIEHAIGVIRTVLSNPAGR